jgi:SAM-dependent methyltransferase
VQEPFDGLRDMARRAELRDAEHRFRRDRSAFLKTLLSLLQFKDELGELQSVLGSCRQRSLLRALSVVACGDEEASLEALHRSLSEMYVQASPGSKSGVPMVGGMREALHSILDDIVDVERSPRFFEFDHIDDIQEILQSRYSVGDVQSVERGRLFVRALTALLDYEVPPGEGELASRLKAELGDFSRFVPSRGQTHPNVRSIIPELFVEFCSIRGADNPARFLEINREYSARQHDNLGAWDARDLSLLREYEWDHHVLLRNLIALIRDGRISSADEVLVVGPRHVNELHFFRKHLGLKWTIGLDLFPSDKGRIIAGDMHQMPFESGRFKLVYVCNTLTYAYNARRVIREICRVTQSPGYAMVIDSGNRVRGPDALGRSDLMSADALVQCFYMRPYKALVKDRGKSLAPEWYLEQPCVLLELS